MAPSLNVECPCCSTRLVVDAETGEVLSEERPKPDTEKTFDQAVSEVRGGTRKREDAFSKAFERTRRLDDILEKKFEEAKKKAAEDASPPRNPFDAD